MPLGVTSIENILRMRSEGVTDLSGAIVSPGSRFPAFTDLRGCNLSGSVMANVTFPSVSLDDCDLTDADLTAANFQGASFNGAVLDGSNLRDAVLDDYNGSPRSALFCKVRLGNRWVGKWHPDKIIAWSVLGAVFDDAVSLDDTNLQVALSRARKWIGVTMLESTFISFGGPDTDFAARLDSALQDVGVQTWFFKNDAIPGRKLHRTMREGVNEHDRVILICSRASLDRPGVLNEIQETLQREARDGGKEYLIPITLDDYVFGDWRPSDAGVAQAIRDRVVADFRGAATDTASFNAGIARLVRALRRP